jgi:hypothetical protein
MSIIYPPNSVYSPEDVDLKICRALHHFTDCIEAVASDAICAGVDEVAARQYLSLQSDLRDDTVARLDAAYYCFCRMFEPSASASSKNLKLANIFARR